MNSKKRVCYIIVIVLMIASIIMTVTKGLKVGNKYAQCYELGVQLKKSFNDREMLDLGKEIFKNNEVTLQKLEYFNNSIVLRLRNEPTDEEIKALADKINEKYEGEKIDAIDIYKTVSPKKQLRTIVEPYILPVGISLLLILLYYAMRYKATTNMLILIRNILGGEILLYSVYALCRCEVNEFTLPLAFVLYGLIILFTTVYLEMKEQNLLKDSEEKPKTAKAVKEEPKKEVKKEEKKETKKEDKKSEKKETKKEVNNKKEEVKKEDKKENNKEEKKEENKEEKKETKTETETKKTNTKKASNKKANNKNKKKK